ncbi:MAG: hypothetical protein M3Z05_04360 [Gemmatimonadota bacterium]|nr:hypothetical protein [Gemmatimonadota bacterium]
MTTVIGEEAASPRAEWWTRPGVVLPVVCSVALLVALLTPQAATGRFGDPRLTSHLANSLGAKVLYEMASRFGWKTVQQDSIGAPVSGDGRTVHAVLAPVTPVTPAEAHRYLEAVRAGDGLLFVVEGRSALSDSLDVTHYQRGGELPANVNASTECERYTEMTPALWADGRVHLFGLRWMRGAPAERTVFAMLQREEQGMRHPGEAAAGFALGRGRVVVVADPDLLRSDVLRHCEWGADVIAVRMLEWLRAGGAVPRTTLVFDEFHQGYGRRSGMMSTAGEFLVGHPVGRAIFAGVLAVVVLLLALAPRPLPPRDVERIERRDPLEQVDALAHAYEQVHATRTITASLLRGLRRRVEAGGVRPTGRSDDTFLETVQRGAPALEGDIAIVRHALATSIPNDELHDVGEAVRRIEDTLTTTNT